MSYLRKASFALLVCFLCYVNVTEASSIAFDKEQFSLIKKQNMGKQWLMLMWSIDCPPCFKELAIIQKLQKQHDDLAVVIINTDADNEITEERTEIIEKFSLNHLKNFHFVDGQSDQSRYIIDSTWYGELPRSYFVQSNGKFHGKSGLVKESTLIKWLAP